MDITDTIRAKSDQLNADDLIGGDILVRIESVTRGPDATQPVEIAISGGHQPWRPSKTSRRVLAAAWGTETDVWVGRWLCLYRDEHVQWAGRLVGGIRIRAMSDIDRPMTLTLAARRGQKVERTIGVAEPPQVVSLDALLEAEGLTIGALDRWLRANGRDPVAKMPPTTRQQLTAWLTGRESVLGQIRSMMEGGDE